MSGLEQSNLFRNLPPAELRSLEETAELRRYERGQVVFKEGDPGEGIYILQSGSVRITKWINASEEAELTRLEPGDFFGEMAVLDGEPRSANAVAELESHAYFIPSISLKECLERSPRLAVNLFREFSLRLREFNKRHVEELLQAERLALLGRFARSLVHDLKNPLGIISFAAELIRGKPGHVENAKLSTEHILKQVDRLSNMINELLEFTTGSRSSVALVSQNVADYMKALVGDYRPELELKGVELLFQNDPPPVTMLADPRRLVHVFHNLFGNAVDAMPQGGRIYLQFELREADLVIRIRDTGPGLDSQIVPKIFEPFSTFGKDQGTGLGLAICRRVIEDHNGTLSVNPNPSRGQGAEFIINLPVVRSGEDNPSS